MPTPMTIADHTAAFETIACETMTATKSRRAAAATADVITPSGLGLSMFVLDHREDTMGAGAEKQKRWGVGGCCA